MRNLIVLFLLSLVFAGTLCAQKIQADSAAATSDTAKMRRHSPMASLFADTATLTTSDYQLQIERAYVILNNVDNKSELGLPVILIKKSLADGDSVLSVLRDNVLNNSSVLSLRNLEVFRTLLQNLQTDLREQRTTLDSTEKKLDALRSSLKPLVEDSILRKLFRDSALKAQFTLQLKDMRRTFRDATKHLRTSLADINALQTHASFNLIATTQLLDKVNTLLTTSTARIFGKEYNYLWEKNTVETTQNASTSIAKAYSGERKAVKYYFKDSSNNRLILLVIGFLAFIWIFKNIRQIRKYNALPLSTEFNFTYLPSAYILSSLVIMLCLAPLFDLHAPSVYIESMQLLLLFILTVLFWKKWPRNLFFIWIMMCVLYLGFSFSHHIIQPRFGQRVWLILLNILSIIAGLIFLPKINPQLPFARFVRFAVGMFNSMNVLSILCNVFGRYSLALMLGNAAVFSIMQVISLVVFSKIITEALLLQMIGSRAKRGIRKSYDFRPVITSFRRIVFVLVVVLWLIVFTTNINIYTSLLNGLTVFLTTPRTIGNASFTLGGIVLFFTIIWIAHFLQRYIGYFFGEVGSDDEIQNKGRRSRLLIARLVLLCIGYLLAVAASGVPVDKITIVLGALGVGIGLGLQNIVNNFVSGIILIFDRPLQIGDIVEVGTHTGRVREIGIRSSTLLTSDGAEVIIPNGDILSVQIVNWTLSNSQRRIAMELSIQGSQDMERVSSLVKTAILQSSYIVKEREPQILFTKINDNGFDLKAFFWCTEAGRIDAAKSELTILLHQVVKAGGLTIEM